MKRHFRCTAAFLGVMALPMAAQGARLVVLPVKVGSSSEPAADLVSALADGLRRSGSWTVIQGGALGQALRAPVGLTDEEHGALAAKRDAAISQLDTAASEAVTALEALRAELAGLARTRTFAPRDFDLAYRTSGSLVGALIAAGNADRARILAQETALVFPTRKPGPEDGLSAAASEALSAGPPEGGGRLTLTSRPAGCEVHVNGARLGTAPVELPALPGTTYQATAVCGAGAQQTRGHPRQIFFEEKDTAREEVLDVSFEQTFRAEGGQRLRFASSTERRDLEETYARRVAERYDADAVVLASVGELSGADWLNARIYFRTGLNRQGLVRLDPGRAAALGSFLITGKVVPGVLTPEEAGALVAASQGGPPREIIQAPWYTDYVGWTFAGLGAIGVTLGLVQNASAKRITSDADALRGVDSERRDGLYREAQRKEFLANIGMIGGGVMAVTGIVLLAIPEYGKEDGQRFVISPVPGGATATLSGRF